MNKKQLIVAWTTAGTLSLFSFVWGITEVIHWWGVEFEYVLFGLFFMLGVPISIIGSLLIYTLRDKKK